MNLRTCFLTENDCYQAGRSIVPQGVMVHSTGANNPELRRYVAPNDGLLGEPSLHHWNQPGRDVCVHAFIGKLADGTVAAYQTLPWTMRGWHCGRGTKGSANDTHLAFEICEDGLENRAYFEAVYREAVELTAYLCRLYGMNPLADGVVLCHAEGYRRGIASNHSDVLHWFPRHGKSMDDFRADTARVLEEERMTEARVREIIRDELQRWETERADLPVSPWAEEGLAAAQSMGITDGSRPQAYATRQEVALMVRQIAEIKKIVPD